MSFLFVVNCFLLNSFYKHQGHYHSSNPKCVTFLSLCLCLSVCLTVSLGLNSAGSPWTGPSRAGLMSSIGSYSTCTGFQTWTCWWAMLTSTVTCCQSTTMTTTAKPSPWLTPCFASSCRGKVQPSLRAVCYILDVLFLSLHY